MKNTGDYMKFHIYNADMIDHCSYADTLSSCEAEDLRWLKTVSNTFKDVIFDVSL